MTNFIQFMFDNPLAAVLLAVILVACVVLVVLYDKARTVVYALVLFAEQRWQAGGLGAEKRKLVIRMFFSVAPGWVKMFVTEAMLDRLICVACFKLYDWLDDGKLNDSVPAAVRKIYDTEILKLSA